MNRILVTGASGFVGRAACAAIDARRSAVHGTYFQHRPDIPGVQWHRLQAFDHAATRELIERVEPTHLLQCAWYMRNRDHLQTAQNLQWVAATLELTRAFCESGGKRAVFTGTYAEYGTREGTISEADEPAPVSLYAVCKDALHRIVCAFVPSHGATYAWTRIFTAYGPYDAPYRLFPYAIDRLRDGREVLATEGRQIRDFVHVSDVGAALAFLLDREENGIFNIGSGMGTAVRDALEMIAALTERGDLLRLGAREQAPGETQRIVASMQRMESLGWRPRVDLRSGLEQMIAHRAQAAPQ